MKSKLFRCSELHLWTASRPFTQLRQHPEGGHGGQAVNLGKHHLRKCRPKLSIDMRLAAPVQRIMRHDTYDE